MGPQLENGYVKIANEIMDALIKFRIPGEQRQCLDFIIRKTYGYNKKEDCIANSQFCAATGLKKGNVSRALASLAEKKVVIKNDNGRIPTYCFNKVYSQWVELSKKQPVIKKATSVIKTDNELLSKPMDTKDSKDTLTKDKKNISIVRPDWFPVEDWKDAMIHRKKKKAADTDRAILVFTREIKKSVDAGWTVAECVDTMCSRDWKGFNSSWMENTRHGHKSIEPISRADRIAEELRARA